MLILFLLTKTLMVQLSPQVIIGESCIASCVVVSLIDNVLTLFRIGQYTRTGASRTKDGGIGKTGYASTLLALQKNIQQIFNS